MLEVLVQLSFSAYRESSACLHFLSNESFLADSVVLLREAI